MFDIDGPGKHVKLTPLGTVPADTLTYGPSRFRHGFCQQGTEQWACFQEAFFTGPSKIGVPIRLPFFLNAGAQQNVRPDLGGPVPADLIDREGRRWALDNPYIAPTPGYLLPRVGHSGSTSTHITATDSLYGSVRVAGGTPMQYRFDVPNGFYHVDLHFVETWAGYAPKHEIGGRVFDVKAEGIIVLPKLDVYKEAGLTPLVKSFDVAVKDAQLTLEWSARGMVSGIAVCLAVQVEQGRCTP